jgi:hypothetical protein
MSFWDIFKRKKKSVGDPWKEGFLQDDKYKCKCKCEPLNQKEPILTTEEAIKKVDNSTAKPSHNYTKFKDGSIMTNTSSDDSAIIDPLLTGIVIGEILDANTDEKPDISDIEDKVETLEDESDFGGGESGGAGAGESFDSSDNDSSSDSSSDSSDSSSSGD